MRKIIKSLKSNLKRLLAKNSGLTFEENSELRTPRLPKNLFGGQANSELLVKNKGFTLIEIIILIVMAGILLPVIIVPFVTGVKSSGKPEMATKAMYLAHEEMEYRMKYNYGGSQLNPTNFTACQASPPSGYQCQYEILYVTSNDLMVVGSINPPDTKYKRIRVRVNDPDNDTYEIYSVATTFP
jgi:type II secretory pathway pseudopilin PulG